MERRELSLWPLELHSPGFDFYGWQLVNLGVALNGKWIWPLCSVQFSCSVVSNFLWPHGLQHARPSCPSPTPGVYSNFCPLRRWCHPTISSSVVPFSSCPQYFPASGSFQMIQLFTSGGQSVKSFSFTISPSNEYSGVISFRMDWLDLLAVPRDSQNSSPTPHFKSINSLFLTSLFLSHLSFYCHIFFSNFVPPVFMYKTFVITLVYWL